MIESGAYYAINLDGGSSSTLVHDGHVVNRPTCLDYVPIPCERPVLSVVCVGSKVLDGDPVEA